MTIPKWLRDRCISYGQIGNDVFILIDDAHGDASAREADEERKDWSARGEGKRRGIERGVGRCPETTMHPRPFPTARFSTQRLSHTHTHTRTYTGNVTMVLLR